MSVEQCQLMGSGSISASDCTVGFVCLFFSPTKTRTATTSLRIGVFSVCQPSYCLLLSLSPPLFPPSGRLSAELSSSSLACSPFLCDDDKDHDDFTKEWRIEGCSQGQGGLARDLLLKLACRSVASQVKTWSS